MSAQHEIIRAWCASCGMPEPSNGECIALVAALNPRFVEPTWKDEPPDWCSPKEEEIWHDGYDCAMASCRAANTAVAVAGTEGASS
ncbi:hypothetical protein J2X90_000728 [Variovorax paradoxus]|uniref:hypothetical protein n=1 Tax=Variovorax paradoxus TaxID=34073 RepID=UPI002785420F|nr:hypothetical protein [Variovorax paradoxus]MDQ0022942.1 hypothetical protein [Variovorax paradoxus]